MEVFMTKSKKITLAIAAIFTFMIVRKNKQLKSEYALNA